MSKSLIGVLLAGIIAGNIITCLLTLALLPPSTEDVSPAETPAGTDLESLGRELARLSDALRSHLATSGETAGARSPGETDLDELLGRFDGLSRRLDGIQKSLNIQAEIEATGEAIELREKRQTMFRANDGHLFAEELLTDKKFALGANGMLTFLEEHPDHPDAQDLMRRARDGFQAAGYLDKALWLQQEIMEKFPEHHGSDLHILSMMERRMKKLDAAREHIDESLRLARTDREKVDRALHRADLIHEVEGDRAGLEAYREVESQAAAVGIGPISDTAKKRAERIEERLDS